VEFSSPVEHIHGNPRELEDLRADLENRSFDVAVNTAGRIHHVIEVLRGRTERLVAISGMGVYRDLYAGMPVPIPEDAPLHDDPSGNRFYYNVAQGEQAVMGAHEQDYFAATVLRYPLIYGPRAIPPFDWYWVKRVLDRRPWVLLPGDGLTLPQRGHARNLAHAVVLALESPQAAGQIYNTGDERSLTVRTLAKLVSEALGHLWELVSVPFDQTPPGNPFATPCHTLLDLSKIKAELGYRDLVGAEEATCQTALWQQENPPAKKDLDPRYFQQAFDYEEEDRIVRRMQT
jgi:nucleoside-diphosphate-sugar epimerase